MLIRIYPVLLILSLIYVGISVIPLTDLYSIPGEVSLVNRFVGVVGMTSLVSALLGYQALEYRYSLVVKGYSNHFLKLNRQEKPAFYLSIGYNIMLGLMFNMLAAPGLAAQSQLMGL